MTKIKAQVDKPFSRRKFIGSMAAITGLTLTARQVVSFPNILYNLGKPNSVINGVTIGAITYSFRSMPCNGEQVLQYCLDAGISAIELLGNTGESFAGAPHTETVPFVGQRPEMTPERRAEMEAHRKEVTEWRSKVSMDKFEQLKKMYKQAGVTIYAWKPDALSERSTDEEIDYAFRSGKALGVSHVTVEIPKDPAQSKRLGAFADKHKLGVGYHGHTQQTFTTWDEAMAQSKYNGLNCDIGHYVAAGFDPIPLLEAKNDRIYSMHIKDRKSKENGGDNMPWGQGNTPIAAALQLMKKNKYKFPATIEVEYNIPENSDAVNEVRNCLEFCRAALSV